MTDCAGCSHYFATSADGAAGLCRWQPPQLAYNKEKNAHLSRWPTVGSDDFCGQWEAPPPAPIKAQPVALSVRAIDAQALGTAPTKIIFQAPTLDKGGYWDAANNRFAPPAGIYNLSCAAGMVALANNTNLFIALYKNGSEGLRAADIGQSAVDITAQLAGTVELALGDYVEMWAWSDKVGNSTLAIYSGFSAYGWGTPSP